MQTNCPFSLPVISSCLVHAPFCVCTHSCYAYESIVTSIIIGLYWIALFFLFESIMQILISMLTVCMCAFCACLPVLSLFRFPLSYAFSCGDRFSYAFCSFVRCVRFCRYRYCCDCCRYFSRRRRRHHHHFLFCSCVRFVWCVLLHFYWIFTLLQFKSHVKRVLTLYWKVRSAGLSSLIASSRDVHTYTQANSPYFHTADDMTENKTGKKIIYRQIETRN